MFKSIIFFCFILTCFCEKITEQQLDHQGKLVTVVLVYRHGARTPIRPYPNDPYKNQSFWPVNFGQLTNVGKQQLYDLGKWFRDRYSQLLPEKYNENDIYVRSSDVDRSLMSAEANLAGLYYPVSDQIWNPDILWQPIPVHTIPKNLDALLAMKKPCPRYDYLFKKLKQSEEIENINRKNQELYKYLTKNSGKEIKSLHDVEYLYSTLNIDKFFNLTLPEWSKSVFPERMKPWASLSFALPCYNKNLARLKAGPFISKVIDNLYNITNKHSRKLWMYSAHDKTIANVLQAMGIFEYHPPPFASTIMFELYSLSDKSFYLNILYKNSSVLLKMTLPGCDFNCPLERFKEILSPVTLPMEIWEEECKNSVSLFLFSPFEEYQSYVVVSTFGVIFLFLTVILLGFICFKHHRTYLRQISYIRIPNK